MVLPVTMSILSHRDRGEVSISRRYEGEAQAQVDEPEESTERQTESLAKYPTGTKANTSTLSHLRSEDEVQYPGAGRQPSRPLRPRETEPPILGIPAYPADREMSGFLDPGVRISAMISIPVGKWNLYVEWLDDRPEGIIRSTFFMPMGFSLTVMQQESTSRK